MKFVENITVDNLPKEVVELKLMSLCNHNIIANSSFSWWGAWMNEHEGKKIIAPKKWFEDEKRNNDFRDIYGLNWIII